MNIRRLEAEPARDAMLAISGDLDRAMGGPSVEASEPRRTVYVKSLRNTPDPLMRVLDAPDGFISTPQRDESTTPAQALMLMNGEWTLGRARALAERIAGEMSSAPAELKVGRVYRLCLGRHPAPDELQRSLALFDEVANGSEAGGEDSPLDPLASLCHVLLNANEFLYID
jgi:hypothetical protein